MQMPWRLCKASSCWGTATGHLMEAGPIYLPALEAAGVGQACHIEHIVTDPHAGAGCCVAGTAPECPKRKVLHREVAAFGHWQHARTCDLAHVGQALVQRSMNDMRAVCHDAVRFVHDMQCVSISMLCKVSAVSN